MVLFFIYLDVLVLSNSSIYLFTVDHGSTPPAAMYDTYYVTAHKAPCRAASFSQNGESAQRVVHSRGGGQGTPYFGLTRSGTGK